MYGRGILSCAAGSTHGITSDELGAYIAYLVATGDEEEGLVYNKRMRDKGQELLDAERSS